MTAGGDKASEKSAASEVDHQRVEAGHSEAELSGNEPPWARVRDAASVAQRRLQTRIWWLTGLCIALAFILVAVSLQERGTVVLIRFQQGHGLKVGDAVRYRGVNVGSVNAIGVSRDQSAVEVAITLRPANRSMAVEGSQFWIQRARVNLQNVSGLDTVVGAKYIVVSPADPKAKPMFEFDGLENPLTLAEAEGTVVQVSFPTAAGLAIGDPVRYRNLVVGEILSLGLTEDLQAVQVTARLVGRAQVFAREGTQFWVERPRIDLTEVRGLDTLVGGRYLAIEPRENVATDQAMRVKFDGLLQPPPIERLDGSLEVEIDAPARMGLVRGAPVLFRGLEVGRVANVDLADDGSSIKVSAIIEADYAALVRDNSEWWAVDGVQINASLQGVDVSIESLAAWLRGGLAFATPTNPGKPVVTGHRFQLAVQENPSRDTWKPHIAVRQGGLEVPLPKAVRLVASWKANWLGLYRRKTLETWALATDSGRIFVSEKFIEQAKQVEQAVMIEVAGVSFPLGSALVGAAPMSLNASDEANEALKDSAWAASEVDNAWEQTDVMMVVNPELGQPLPIDGTRISKLDDGDLQIAEGISIPNSCEGSPVAHARSGKVFGILIRRDDRWRVAPLP